MFAAAGAVVAGNAVADTPNLAPIKFEGSKIPYDEMDFTPGPWIEVADAKNAMLYDDLHAPLAPVFHDGARKGNAIVTRAEFRKILADSLNKAFSDQYANEPGDLRELFNDEDTEI